MILKVSKSLFSIIISVIEFIIINLPDNTLGLRLRKYFYKKSLKNFGNNSKVCSGSKFYNKKSISIGNNLSMANNVILDANDSFGIYIGNFVSISDGTYFRSANHIYNIPNKKIQEQGHECAEIEFLNDKFSIVIEDDVWIGARVVLISGAYVGRGSVILSGSVVNKNIPEYEVWGGVPCKFISKR
tara:strand:+ start:790 stop:1347 length:558 start_codon:yes stop_codon:yes gene_type:complete